MINELAPMDEKIQYVVQLFYYPMWFVIRDNDIMCPCVNYETKQAKLGCPICLGTGHKIKIVREKAARQTTESLTARGKGMGFGECNPAERYFTLTDLKLVEGDIIIDGTNVNIVQWYMPGRTDHPEPVYYRCVASRMKNNKDLFLRAFRNLIRKAGYEL